MYSDLDGKIALVTGGCSGIGLAIVEAFLAQGARVVICDLQAEKGAELARQFPGVSRFIRCDVSSEADIAAAVALAGAAFGGLDITCNNAGYGGPVDRIEDISVAKWDAALGILLRGPMLGIKHSIPAMRARGAGSIINTSSIAGLHSELAHPAYAVAKAAILQLTRKAAAEVARDRIRVNTICPGFIASPIFGTSMGLSAADADTMARELEQQFATLQPLPYAGLPSDIANTALYLASSASRFVTGTEIVVDGGILLKPGLDTLTAEPGSLFATIETVRARIVGGGNEMASAPR